MSDGGKGSNPRPFSVTQEEFAENWKRIFGSKELHTKGDQRITPAGKLEEYREGYWHEIENRR
jgi:hypothetical protein